MLGWYFKKFLIIKTLLKMSECCHVWFTCSILENMPPRELHISFQSDIFLYARNMLLKPLGPFKNICGKRSRSSKFVFKSIFPFLQMFSGNWPMSWPIEENAWFPLFHLEDLSMRSWPSLTSLLKDVDDLLGLKVILFPAIVKRNYTKLSFCTFELLWILNY